jgi:transcriptional regulator with XRE-family HTH domain
MYAYRMTSQSTQLAKALKKAISTFGLTLKEVEHRLGLSRGYLSRLFGGQMDIKVDHVVQIGEVLGVEPEELFRLAFPPDASSPSQRAMLLREAFGVTAPEPGPQAPSALEREIEEVVKRAMARTFAKLQP